MILEGLNLKEAITCAVNHIEIGGEDKKTIIEEVTQYINDRYVTKEKVKEIVPQYWAERI